MKPSNRCYRFALIFIPLFAFSTSLFLEFFKHLAPCPLCITQRIVFFVLFALFALKAFHRPKKFGNWIYNLLGLGVSSLGLWAAGRQIWLQHLPKGLAPSCMPSLDVLFEIMPFTEMIKTFFQGTGDCAKTSYFIAGMSLPVWSSLTGSLILILIVCEMLSQRS